MALVLDESQSVAAANATADVRTGANAFVRALAGTGSSLRLFRFARWNAGEFPSASGYPVVDSTNVSGFEDWVNNTGASAVNITNVTVVVKGTRH